MKTCLAKIFSAAAALLFSATSLARADWILTSADFTIQSGLTVNTWDVDGLSVTNTSGKLVKLDSRSVVSLIASRPAASATDAATPWKLALRNGDLLSGEPAGISGQSLQFHTAEMGTLLIPLKMIATLTASNATLTTSAPSDPDKDVVYLQNNDTAGGFILSLDADKIQLSTSTTDTTTTDIQMHLVHHIAFSGTTPPRTVPPLSARITFTSGSILTVPQKNLAWSINDITLKDLADQEHKIAADKISRIEILGGRVVYLSDLDPAHEEQTTFMNTPWPTRTNQNVLEQPLKVAKTTYPRGLGVHTRSLLTYDLGGNFAILKLRVGLDDSAAPRGEADLSILGDGKILWQSKSMKAGQISPDLNLPVANIKTLELHADPASSGTTGGSQNIDVLGRVDWLNLALIRP